MIAKAVAVMAAALVFVGCIRAEDEAWGSFEMASFSDASYVDLGTIEVVSVNVTRYPSPITELAAKVQLVLRTDNAETPWVEVILDDLGCSTYGPPSTPSSRVAAAWRTLPDDGLPRLHWINVTLRGDAAIGLEGSVYVSAEAENAIGPIFGECREFKRVP